jgi:pSer/pThr/pTyr-binding forkhead associated (FHA) protein
MERVMFIEILNRRGAVEERIRVDSLPVTIGRAYTNDVILSDKHICPEHMRVFLDENGTPVAEDLNSRNGIYRNKPRERASRIEIHPDTVVRAGQTTLRFRWSDHGVPPAEVDRAGVRRFFGAFNNRYAAGGVFLLSAVAIMLSIFLETYSKFEFSDLLENIVPMIILFAVWAGFWSFVNRLVSHSFRFLPHLALAGVMVTGIIVYAAAFEYAAFLLSLPLYFDVVELSGYAFLFAVLLFGHLSIITPSSPAKRVIASILIAVGLFGTFGLIAHLESSEFSGGLQFSSDLKPVNKRWLSKVSTEEFFGGLGEIREEIDEIARKEKEKREEEREAKEKPAP